MGDLNEHFSRTEFECKCGKCNTRGVDVELLTALTKIREHFNARVTITSGNRCKIWNTNQGGAKGSEHTKGIAADFKVEGQSPHSVASLLDEWYPDKYGIGTYPSWVHLDVRETKARW